MNADQRAKFEKWAADADKRNRRRAVGRVDAWEGWCACLAANAIDQPPADDERERLRDLLRRCLAHVEQYDNLRTEITAALGTWEDGE